MSGSRLSKRWAILFVSLVIVAGAGLMLFPQALTAQPEKASLEMYWFGPVGMTRAQTARFDYTNHSDMAVQIAWTFSNARTGKPYGDITRYREVGPRNGVEWDLGADRVPPNDFDKEGRAQIVGCLIVLHAPNDRKRADLGMVEIFDMESGKTTAAVDASPGAASYKY